MLLDGRSWRFLDFLCWHLLLRFLRLYQTWFLLLVLLKVLHPVQFRIHLFVDRQIGDFIRRLYNITLKTRYCLTNVEYLNVRFRSYRGRYNSRSSGSDFFLNLRNDIFLLHFFDNMLLVDVFLYLVERYPFVLRKRRRRCRGAGFQSRDTFLRFFQFLWHLLFLVSFRFQVGIGGFLLGGVQLVRTQTGRFLGNIFAVLLPRIIFLLWLLLDRFRRGGDYLFDLLFQLLSTIRRQINRLCFLFLDLGYSLLLLQLFLTFLHALVLFFLFHLLLGAFLLHLFHILQHLHLFRLSLVQNMLLLTLAALSRVLYVVFLFLHDQILIDKFPLERVLHVSLDYIIVGNVFFLLVCKFRGYFVVTLGTIVLPRLLDAFRFLKNRFDLFNDFPFLFQVSQHLALDRIQRNVLRLFHQTLFDKPGAGFRLNSGRRGHGRRVSCTFVALRFTDHAVFVGFHGGRWRATSGLCRATRHFHLAGTDWLSSTTNRFSVHRFRFRRYLDHAGRVLYS